MVHLLMVEGRLLMRGESFCFHLNWSLVQLFLCRNLLPPYKGSLRCSSGGLASRGCCVLHLGKVVLKTCRTGGGRVAVLRFLGRVQIIYGSVDHIGLINHDFRGPDRRVGPQDLCVYQGGYRISARLPAWILWLHQL